MASAVASARGHACLSRSESQTSNPSQGSGIMLAQAQGQSIPAVGVAISCVAQAEQTSNYRILSSKRKLDEIDMGCCESSCSASTQVRARRDNGNDGATVECRGRERHQEAQPLDADNEMREEGGNLASDADVMWENVSAQETQAEVSWKGSAEWIESVEDSPDLNMKELFSNDAIEDDLQNEVPIDHASTDCNINFLSHDDLEGVLTERIWHQEVASTSSMIQFFVKTLGCGGTMVFQANASETVEWLQRQIEDRSGLPFWQQRLLYCGRQLQLDQTLEQSMVTNDATLTLVGRMRSTLLPHSWQLANDIVSTIRHMCESDGKYSYQESVHVRSSVREFLKLATSNKSMSIVDHMEIFQLSGATSALIMLLHSPIQSNRTCAAECITYFFSSNEDYLPIDIHPHCAPVLMEFLKLLAQSAPNDKLYPTCRHALALMRGSSYFNEANSDTIIVDLPPFVHELALKLTSTLVLTPELSGDTVRFREYYEEAQDFAAFFVSFCRAWKHTKVSEEQVSFQVDGLCSLKRIKIEEDGVSSPESCTLNLLTNNEISCHQIGSETWLYSLFVGLLQEIDKCLQLIATMGDKSGEIRSSWGAPIRLVLRSIYEVTSLFGDAMEQLLTVLSRHRGALNLLVQQSKWQDDDFWLLHHKGLLDFESKKQLVLAMLPELQDDHDGRQELMIQRSQLLTDSFEQLAYADCDMLQGGLCVEFTTEEATGPGVLREWFFLICREIFNPQNALFIACPDDRRRFFPNSGSGVNPGHLTYFKFCGRLVALALMHKVHIDVRFSTAFFKQLAGVHVTWEDSKDADPILYQSCKKVLEMDPGDIDSDALCLTFVCEVEYLGSHKIIELCPGGKDISVNSSNRKDFVELLVNQRLVTSVTEQISSFKQGFSDLLINFGIEQFLGGLDLEDLDLILYGKEHEISVDDWKRHTEYHEYTSMDDHIQWFWKVVEEMSIERRRRLLYFATSVAHLPAEGFAGLQSKFHIHRGYGESRCLPTAHTCFFQLILPTYPSFSVMHECLHAITEAHVAEGFGFA